MKKYLISFLLLPRVNKFFVIFLSYLIHYKFYSATFQYFWRRLPSVPGHVVNLDFEGTKCKFYAEGSMGRDFLWTREYPEKETLSLFLYLMHFSDVVLDIGSNIGMFSINGAIRFPKSNIFAFEPVPNTLDILKKNIKMNDVDNVSTNNIVFDSEKKDNVTIYVPGDDSLASVVPPEYNHRMVSFTVSSNTLDLFCMENEILEKVDLIKIDVEGLESRVFKAGANLLKRSRPFIICEVFRSDVADELNTVFRRLNYAYYNITHSGLVSCKEISVSKGLDDRNWLFLPKEKMHLLNEYKPKLNE